MSIETTTRIRAWRREKAPQLMRWLAVPALAIAGVAVGSGPVDASRDIVPAKTREVLDVLQLRCEGNDRAVAEVACRWTVPDGVVGVKVLRVAVGSGASRHTVYRSADPSINHFVDSPVRRGVRYLYVVRAFDAAGTLVAASRPAVAGVAVVPDPTIDVLRLDCSATGSVTARCRWTAPTSPARVLTLWRSVDGGVRERVVSFANPFPTSYGDVVPTATSRAVYAVIATDGAGEIVARSRADGLTFPPVRVDARPVVGPPLEVPADVIADSIDPEPARPTSPTIAPPTAPVRPQAEADPSQRFVPVPDSTIPRHPEVVDSRVPTTSVPVTTVPTVDVPPAAPTRSVDVDRPAGESDGDNRSGSRNDSGRSVPSGEQDRAR